MKSSFRGHDFEKYEKGLASFSIRNPHFILVVCILTTVLGVLSYILLPKDLLPSVKMPAIQILSFYSGMPVEHVEKNLTARFERYTGQAIGISKQESRSLNGVSIVKNYFSDSTDINTAIAQTTSLVMSVLRRLPPGTQPPLVMPFDPTASVPIGLIAVSGEGAQKQLYDYARYDVRNSVQAISGAMAPTVMGGSERQVTLYLNRDKLKQYNLSPLEVLSKINSLNTFIPSGSVKLGDTEFQITSNGLADKISEMNDFPLRSGQGDTVYLKDVGEAKDAQKIQTNFVLIDGKPNVYVPIYRQPGANTIEIIDQVKRTIKDMNQSNDKMSLKLVGDQSNFVRKAIDSISEEALIGGGMAALLVLLFLGNVRATAAIALSIPISFLFAFIGIKATGHTLNAMTLGGLALAVGVLVDNSIVVIENTFTHLEHHASPLNAAIMGAHEVAMPVFISTICTLVVFTPILFLQGLIKYLFAALAAAVIFAMIASYFISMTVIPLYNYRFIHKIEQSGKIHSFISNIINQITTAYGSTLVSLRENKSRLFIALGFLVGIVCLLIPHVGMEFFPKSDAGSFILEAHLKSGTRVEETARIANDIEKDIRQWIPKEDLETVLINVGVYYGYPAAFTPNSGSQDMFFNIQLTEDRSHTSQHYAEELRKKFAEKYPNVEYGFQLGGLLSSALNGGLKAPINIGIQGPHLEEAHDIAEQLVTKIKTLKGARDVRVEEKMDAPQIQVLVDRKISAQMGLTTDEVIKNVVSAVSNSASFNASIWVDPKSGIDYLLGVQFDEKTFKEINDLLKIPITGKDRGRSVLLEKLVSLKKAQGPTEINHSNLKPTVNVYVNNFGRDLGSLSQEIEKLIREMNHKPEYKIFLNGEYSEMQKSLSLVGGGFLLATFLVYLLLVIQFRDWMAPLVIILAVPLGMAGVVISFYLTNTYFSIQAAMGAIFLIGIGVSNSVLLIEFIIKKIQQGTDISEAVIEGSKARLRPIMMTALASIMGLVPMAIGLGKGSEANIPLGRAVVGGQLIGVPLMLLLVPILFEVLAAKRFKAKDFDSSQVTLLPEENFVGNLGPEIGENVG